METLYIRPDQSVVVGTASRRNILKITAAAAAAIPIAACTSTTTPATVLPAVIAFIQSLMLKSCSIIPSAITIATVIADAFPAAAGVATIAEALAAEIVAAMCPTTPPASTTVLAVKLKTGNTVVLHGFHVVNGVLVEF